MLEFLQYGLFVRLQSALVAARNREEGQAMVEYALILALVSVVAIGVLTDIGNNIVTKLTSVANAL
jgi:pilus assembly protein Flp/PilA